MRKKYRHKTLYDHFDRGDIEAMQFKYNAESTKELGEWMGSALGPITKARYPGAKARLVITGNTGYLVASEDSFIIKDKSGNFQPITEITFNTLYEEIE